MTTKTADFERTTTEAEEYNPDAPASPEAIELVHRAIDIIIENAPENFVWNTPPTRGEGDLRGDFTQSVQSIRLLSQPSRIDPDGSKWGESFTWISFFDDSSGTRQIMVTEDQGSGSPYGDILTTNASVVRRISRSDTVFLPNIEALVRKGFFTFGPAQLERRENEAQVNNPFVPATHAQLDRIGEILASGTIHSHNGKNRLPPLDELETIPIIDLLLQD